LVWGHLVKKIVAVAAAFVWSSAAYANTACDAPASVTVGQSSASNVPDSVFPPGNYEIITDPATGQPAILFDTPGANLPVRISQLALLGLPITVNTSTPVQTSCGSPASSNFTSVADALDLHFNFESGADSDTVGLTGSYWQAGGDSGQRLDVQFQHGMHIAAGRRARVVIGVPLHLFRVEAASSAPAGGHGGMTSFTGGINVGVEVPVARDWWLTPRVAYGVTAASHELGGASEQAAVTLASNVRLRVGGRGELTVGNLVGYTKAIRTGITGQSDADYFGQENLWLRNGVAYQLPLKHMVFGRQASLRGSYTFTQGLLDALAFTQTHEVAVSLGFRTREAVQRTADDLFRVGLLYTHARNDVASHADYDAITLTVGFRF
jgi:hypothetical protein